VPGGALRVKLDQIRAQVAGPIRPSGARGDTGRVGAGEIRSTGPPAGAARPGQAGGFAAAGVRQVGQRIVWARSDRRTATLRRYAQQARFRGVEVLPLETQPGVSTGYDPDPAMTAAAPDPVTRREHEITAQRGILSASVPELGPAGP
jgi:hypothetical protein